VSATRRSERRGREYVVIFESPNPAARKAKVTGMVCD
jgi:hypothetical protein